MRVKIAAVLILLGLALLFIVQNVTVVRVTFLFWSFQISLVLLIFLVLVVGLLAGWVLHGLTSHPHSEPPV
jgi:lipopolysaccharide assembly protein A